MRDFPVKTPDGKGWERSSMRNFSGFKMICSPSVHGNNLLQLCIAEKECEMNWVEPERFCCWGNTLWPARKNVRTYTRSNCHRPLLILSHDSLYLKFRNSMPVNRGKKSLKNGKRHILIKVGSKIKFKDYRSRACCKMQFSARNRKSAPWKSCRGPLKQRIPATFYLFWFFKLLFRDRPLVCHSKLDGVFCYVELLCPFFGWYFAAF